MSANEESTQPLLPEAAPEPTMRESLGAVIRLGSIPGTEGSELEPTEDLMSAFRSPNLQGFGGLSDEAARKYAIEFLDTTRRLAEAYERQESSNH